jgi:transposase
MMSRFNRWKKDGTLDRITAALRFKPMTDDERHHRQGYGTIQRAQFRRDGFNPWLYDRDDDTDMGKLSKLWETGRR